MVVHEAEGVTEPGEAPNDAREQFEKEASVGVVEEDASATIAPARHVVESSGDLEAKGAGHSSERKAALGLSPLPARSFRVVVRVSMRSIASSDPGPRSARSWIASSDPGREDR